jgi:hypothetical protein
VCERHPWHGVNAGPPPGPRRPRLAPNQQLVGGRTPHARASALAAAAAAPALQPPLGGPYLIRRPHRGARLPRPPSSVRQSHHGPLISCPPTLPPFLSHWRRQPRFMLVPSVRLPFALLAERSCRALPLPRCTPRVICVLIVQASHPTYSAVTAQHSGCHQLSLTRWGNGGGGVQAMAPTNCGARLIGSRGEVWSGPGGAAV